MLRVRTLRVQGSESLIPSRWEHGSEFHWLEFASADESGGADPWGQAGVFCASGRDALRLLVLHGMSQRGWLTLWIPSYMCHTVVRSIAQTGVEMLAYPDDPRWVSPNLPNMRSRAGDVVLVVNHFGMRTAPSDGYPCDVIEDHTHDPWSDWACGSEAAYCVASFRKTLPLPDGAVLWSPTGQVLPEEPPCGDDACLSSALRLSGALLKRRYLEDGPVKKESYLRLFKDGELAVARQAPSGMTPWAREQFASLPLGSWRQRRKEGWLELSRLLGEVPGVTILHPADVIAMVPLGMVMVMRDGLSRDRMVEHLRRHAVYAAVLWRIERDDALPGTPDGTVELSERVLFLHSDGRYGVADHARVAAVVADGM